MSKWNEWKKNLGDSRPWHLLDPSRYTDEEVAKKRLKICEGCEFYKITKQCEKCGCFMPAKTKLSISECPIGKWGKEEEYAV